MPVTAEVADAAPVAVEPTPPPKVVRPKPNCSERLSQLRSLDEIRALVEAEGCNGHSYSSGRVLLHSAAKEGRNDIVAFLISAGVDVDFALPRQDVFVGSMEVGMTALWAAVSANHPETAKLLLAAGANPNLCPPAGVSPLLMAVADDDLDLVKALVAAGADPRHTAAGGESAMTFGKGPSARMFAYLTEIGVPTDDLAPPVVEWLRWEAAHDPGHDVEPGVRLAFLIEVLGKSVSIQSRELALREIAQLGRAARAAVPAVLAVMRGPTFGDADWSQVVAAVALNKIGWVPQLDAEVPSLLATLRSGIGGVRIELTELVGREGPPSKAVVTTFIAMMSKEPNPEFGARGLGLLLARDSNLSPVLRKKAMTALRRAAANQKDRLLREAAQAALQQLPGT